MKLRPRLFALSLLRPQGTFAWNARRADAPPGGAAARRRAYFVILRDPVARLVSEYNYCHHIAFKDQCCGGADGVAGSAAGCCSSAARLGGITSSSRAPLPLAPPLPLALPPAAALGPHGVAERAAAWPCTLRLPSFALSARRSVPLLMAEADDEYTAWPQPKFSVEELRDQEEQRKEAAEAAAMASPKPFIAEEGNFSVVALSTVIVFIIGASVFFQGITGGGIARFGDINQSPEIQACINKATTRDEASACLPPVPLT